MTKQYLRRHAKKYLINSINDFFDYDKIQQQISSHILIATSLQLSTKTINVYKDDKNNFKASSLALHFCTTIKKVSDLLCDYWLNCLLIFLAEILIIN